MWFGLSNDQETKIPNKLISAHTEGRLVLFVGAGASVAPPSGLPAFRELTEKLCEESQEPLPEKSAALDGVLGRLEKKGVDVHQKVKTIISHSESKPNDLHKTIAELATAKKPRIVTTNYDRHLSACLEECLSGESLEEYPSLAFPQREGFTGIVYLHGSVKEPAEHLVITDADFGRAYLEAPWTAAQFLSGVFRSSAVLFIGYSHNDTLMEYLARSLPADETDRFALCSQDEYENGLWQQRGIEPISYGTHEVLPKLLRKWVKRARMGILEHRQRVETITQGEPPLSREDDSYMQETVLTPERLRFFTKSARGAEWLRWAKGLSDFKRIFNPRAELQPNDDLWIKWFVDHFAMDDDPELRQEAFSVFFDLRGNFSFGLLRKLAISCGKPLKDGSDAVREAKKWLPLLIRHVPLDGEQPLAMLLSSCDPERDRHAMLLLANKLFEPQPVQSRYSHFEDTTRLEPSLGRYAIELGYYWKLPNLSDQALASSVAAILDRHLRTAHLIAASNSDDKQTWIRLSFTRSAIEDHEQDKASRNEGIGLLIDIARDTLEALLEHHLELAKHYLRSWEKTQMPLLQRLAIHGWAERSDVTADEKIAQLCDSHWIANSYLRHETMRLVAVALPEASPDTINHLVEHIEAELQNKDEHSERRIYEWLAWIVDNSASALAAKQALVAVQAKHPDWAPSDHPDLLGWVSAEKIERPNLCSPEELHQMIKDDPADAVKHLLSFPPNAGWNKPEWWDALSWLHTTVNSYPADGVNIIDVLTGPYAPEDPNACEELAKAAFGAWTRSELSDTLSQAIVDRLLAIWDTGTAQWTSNAVTTNSSVGPFTQALNHWAGQLAQVVLRLVHREYQTAGEGWGGLTGPTKTVMESMTNASSYASRHAQVVLANRLSFLFTLDEQWCCSTLLPLLNPNINMDQAIACWDGLLFGRIGPPKLLGTDLLDLFVEMAQHLANRHDETGKYYHQRLAEASLFYGINPIEQGWLDRYTASTTKESHVKWIRQVAYALSRLSSSAADAQWDAWMHKYWNNRLASTPNKLTDEEATALAGWTLSLANRFPKAVELACQHKATVEENSMTVIRLCRADDQPERVDHLEEHPEHTARLLTHLLTNTERNLSRYLTLEVELLSEMIPNLLKHITPQQARLLREQAVRLDIDNLPNKSGANDSG